MLNCGGAVAVSGCGGADDFSVVAALSGSGAVSSSMSIVEMSQEGRFTAGKSVTLVPEAREERGGLMG